MCFQTLDARWGGPRPGCDYSFTEDFVKDWDIVEVGIVELRFNYHIPAGSGKVSADDGIGNSFDDGYIDTERLADCIFNCGSGKNGDVTEFDNQPRG